MAMRYLRFMSTVISLTLLLAVMAISMERPAHAQNRIKDIASFEGVRSNKLIGYGLVVGLNGTGDDLSRSIFTRESLIGMLQRMGVNTRSPDLKTENVAAVMVTAELPAFARQGTNTDITVSALGDADSLQGGTLLVTPLLGADGEVYAVAQGPLSVGGFEAEGAATSVTRGTPTSARIANGATIEKEIGFELNSLREVKLSLHNPDFTTARRAAQSINALLNNRTAEAIDNATINIRVPADYPGSTVDLLTDIEQLPVRVDQPARVVIDEHSGVIVMGEQVRISEVAIAQGNLTIRITETPQVSQPNPFGEGETVVVPRTQIEVDEDEERKLAVMPEGVSLRDLVNGLNALGVGPRDMIKILEAIKAAGALQADLEVM
ncbi:flagellar basal body P-ring protein FlgI [Fodinicurvata halophila]|uniref:Flagellar P-ring protein n=1 Tax=Fodinicurvata halophila TaxID=1419723 RepID=A0ABV8UIN8_9PROT